jgi:hypothetical protein
MIGYKATNADMQCRGFQFELGKWYEAEGELKLCHNGFHFCEQPSGVWAHYSNTGTRVFTVECEDVSPEKDETVGATIKRVCRKIRFIEEIKIGGDRNTGYSNTGDSNTGDRNTGDRNTGDSNTGNWNTGYSNTGYSNTGYSNTGDSNTGNWNTGYSNTGDRNTGNSNTGDRNTGDSNTGDSNATNRSAGMFCQVEPKVISFDVRTKLTYDEFMDKYSSICNSLAEALAGDAPIAFERYTTIPGITKAKLTSLHDKFIAARKAKA